MTLRAMGLALCAAALAFGQTATDWRFAHPDADMRISINFQAVLNSEPVTAALKKAEEGTTKEQTAQIQMVVGILSSIDRVAISARQKPAGAKPAAATSAASLSQDSDALVWVTGTFDPKVVLNLFPSTGTSKVQQVGPHAILIGEGDSFAKSLARISGQAAAGPSDELADNDLWIAGNTAMMGAAPSTPGSPISLQDVKRFSLGVNFKASPEVNVHLTAADDAGAGRMMGQMQLLTLMAGAAPQTAQLQKMIQLKQEGPTVKLHMVIPPELLQMAQAMAQQNLSNPGAGGGPGASSMSGLMPLLGLLGMGGGASQPAAAQPAPAPKPSGDIVIYGLDDGPRVIKNNQ